MSRWASGTKHSQLTMDAFEAWKKEQNAAIARQGANEDEAKEEEHNKFMLRQNLNAYICHMQLDDYTGCLRQYHLLREEDDPQTGNRFEIDTRQKKNERLCRKSHNAYVKCMTSQQNQNAILEDAAEQPHCRDIRGELLACMARNNEVELATHTPMCTTLYRALLRCGLNHQWNRYWRGITKFGDPEEFNLFELSRSDSKRQELMRFTNSSPEDMEEHRQYLESVRQGYFSDTTVAEK